MRAKLLFVLLPATVAFGQTSDQPMKLGDVTVTGTLRLRAYGWDWFQPSTFGYTGRATSGRRSLGNLYDTSVEYRATRRVTFTGYVGYTQGLAGMEQIYPKRKDGRFGYLEALFKF